MKNKYRIIIFICIAVLICGINVPNRFVGNAAGGNTGTVLLSKGSNYKYLNDGTDVFSLASDWTTDGFNDSAWKSGAAPLGFSNNVYSVNTNIGPSGKYMFFNFRTTFTVDKSKIKAVEASIIFDDAPVVYLNGNEIYRNNIEGEINKNSCAVTYIGTASEYEKFYISADDLVDGVNTLAVVVFQDKVSSSDLLFDMEIVGFDSVELSLEDNPQAVTLTYYNDPATSRGFSWYTGAKINDGYLKIVEKTGALSKTNVNWNDSAVRTVKAGFVRDGIYNSWKAQLTDLQEGKSYLYKVGSAAFDIWSGTGQFSMSSDSGTVSFLHTTDAQESNEAGYRAWANCVDAAYKTIPTAQFMIFSGDMVNTSTNYSEWNWALNLPKQNLMDNVIVPASGNHDDAKDAFKNRFNIEAPEGSETSTGIYYSFDKGNVHFTVLNTNDPPFNQNQFMSTKQVNWLKADLASTDKPWKILVMHKGLISSGSHTYDPDIINMRTQLLPVISEYNVDLVLQGHDHVYFRSLPYKWNGNGIETDKNTTQYTELYNGKETTFTVESGGAVFMNINYSGTKKYEVEASYDKALIQAAQNPYSGTQMSLQPGLPMFGAVEINGNKLVYNTYTVNGSNVALYDSYAVLKDSDTAVTSLIEKLPSAEEFSVQSSKNIIAVYRAYEALSEPVKSLISQTDKTKLEQLAAKVDFDAYYKAETFDEELLKIGEVSLNYADKKKISDLLKEYGQLSDIQKSYVQNYNLLLEADKRLENLTLSKSIDNLLKELDQVILSDKQAVIAAREAYDALTEEQKRYVKQYQMLTAAEEKLKYYDVSNGGSERVNTKDIIIWTVSGIAAALIAGTVATVLIVKLKRRKQNG